jgi:hypothetical protein
MSAENVVVIFDLLRSQDLESPKPDKRISMWLYKLLVGVR